MMRSVASVALLTIGEIAIAGLDIINNSLNSTT